MEVEKNAERRSRVLLGPLRPDFLRIEVSDREQQEAADQQAALALQQQLTSTGAPAVQPHYYQNISGWLSITVTQAKLVKNYGMTRMDPYVRLRIGHGIYETHTDPNGGKNPRWNKVIQCMLPQGLNSIYAEIYDECSFTMDELIAWSNITIPPAVLGGETREDWYPLSGKQGEGLEGMLHLVLSFSTSPPRTYNYQQVAPVMMVPSTVYGAPSAAMPVYVAPAPVSPAISHVVPPQLTPEQIEAQKLADLKLISEMFPHLDKDVIKTIHEASHGNKEVTINKLLQLTE